MLDKHEVPGSNPGWPTRKTPVCTGLFCVLRSPPWQSSTGGGVPWSINERCRMGSRSQLGVFIAVGAAIGVAIGAGTHHMAEYLALGVGIGAALGVAVSRRGQ